MSADRIVAYKMKNSVQNYGWGDTEAIPTLLGINNSEGKPFAELWMGAHPKAPSMLSENGSLLDQITASPVTQLGEEVFNQFGRLPYLFKVLSAGSPLSIQVHPDKKRAEEGFRFENEQGIALDAFNRNYKDDNHKPEIICALTPFWAMRGFRTPEAVSALVESIGSPALSEAAVSLKDESLIEEARLKGFFLNLLNFKGDQAEKLMDEVLANTDPGENDVFRWIHKLAGFYPGDCGALAPVYLHLIQLQPGEALYLSAGVLHAYLEGTGMELMANSDNVLRGGLTPKYMDPPELTAVVNFSSEDPQIILPVASGDESVYPTPSGEFQLGKVSLKGMAELKGPVAPSILIALEGCCTVGDVEISRGESLFIPFNESTVEIKGEGTFYRAAVPQ